MPKMPSEKLDDESSLPRATVDKLIQDLTPNGYSVSKDVRSRLRDSAHAFLNIVALEANRLCDTEKKKTISIGHILKSMEKSGFGDFVHECETAAKNYDEYTRHKPSKQNKFKESGKSMEELEALQMQLFKQAAEQQMKEYEIEDLEETDE